jgi:hypothetical protein
MGHVFFERLTKIDHAGDAQGFRKLFDVDHSVPPRAAEAGLIPIPNARSVRFWF